MSTNSSLVVNVNMSTSQGTGRYTVSRFRSLWLLESAFHAFTFRGLDYLCSFIMFLVFYIHATLNCQMANEIIIWARTQVRLEGCTTQNTRFRHKRLNVHADFKRVWNFAHILCVSTPRRDLRGWFPFFFCRMFLVLWGPNFPNNLITDQRPCKKKIVRSGLRQGSYTTFATFRTINSTKSDFIKIEKRQL